MTGERQREQLERHIHEAEERAAAGGHELGPWQTVPHTGLFVREAACLRCGEKVEVGYTSMVVNFARQCPGEEE